MKFAMLLTVVLSSLVMISCAGKKKQYDDAMIEKYPGCYHDNFKIYEKCVKKNEMGEKTTAVELENTAYPGQYN